MWKFENVKIWKWRTPRSEFGGCLYDVKKMWKFGNVEMWKWRTPRSEFGRCLYDVLIGCFRPACWIRWNPAAERRPICSQGWSVAEPLEWNAGRPPSAVAYWKMQLDHFGRKEGNETWEMWHELPGIETALKYYLFPNEETFIFA